MGKIVFRLVEFRCECGRRNAVVVSEDTAVVEHHCDCGKLYKRIGDMKERAEVLHDFKFSVAELVFAGQHLGRVDE